jgi:hypothetical protein
MSDFKNLKVAFQIHEMLNKRRKVLGVKQQALTEALLLVGLRMSDAEIHKAVVASQLITQPTDSTSPEPQPQTP